MNETVALSQTADTIKYTAVVYAVFATVFGGIGCYIITRWKIEKPHNIFPV